MKSNQNWGLAREAVGRLDDQMRERVAKESGEMEEKLNGSFASVFTVSSVRHVLRPQRLFSGPDWNESTPGL